jgi:hypothetical protein
MRGFGSARAALTKRARLKAWRGGFSEPLTKIFTDFAI